MMRFFVPTRQQSSSLGINYPKYRDHPLHTGELWLASKRLDDGAENLWRIHDKLYDLEKFIEFHPGGPDWIKMTKGTDITEAFETHHLSTKAEEFLPKLFKKPATTPRNSPFTFHKYDFYQTLKGRVYNELPKLPKTPIQRTKLITDALMLSYLILSTLSAYLRSFSIGICAGIFLSLTAIAAHNYFHQKDNFRMHYFDFTLLKSKSWRISHVLSHHLYTNTVNDLEISKLEPLIQYLPNGQKTFLDRYLPWLYSPIVYCLIFYGEFALGMIQMILNKERSYLTLLPFSILIAMLLTTHNLFYSILMFIWIQMIASLHFAVVGLNAGHHHPDSFHDGDTPRPITEMDWGVYQVDAVMDRKEITGSHFLVLTHFGDHALHHLFPTLDHGILEYLYPVFLRTCEEFGVDFRLTTQFELVKGQFRQIAKNVPKPVPPKPLKQIKIE